MKKLKHSGFLLICLIGILAMGSFIIAQTVNNTIFKEKQEPKKVVGKKNPISTKKEKTFEVPTTALEKNVGLAKKLPVKKQVAKVAPSEALKREHPDVQVVKKAELTEEHINTKRSIQE